MLSSAKLRRYAYKDALEFVPVGPANKLNLRFSELYRLPLASPLPCWPIPRCMSAYFLCVIDETLLFLVYLAPL